MSAVLDEKHSKKKKIRLLYKITRKDYQLLQHLKIPLNNLQIYKLLK
jgi:hypothetical protein